MYVGDLRDGAFLHQIFTENKIDGVINFAAFSLVGESVTNPLKYYGNNVEGAVSPAVGHAGSRRGQDRVFLQRRRPTASRRSNPLRKGTARNPPIPTARRSWPLKIC